MAHGTSLQGGKDGRTGRERKGGVARGRVERENVFGGVREGSGGKEVHNLLITQAQAHPNYHFCVYSHCQLAPIHPAGCNTFLFLSTPTILPNSPSLSSPYHLSIRVPRVVLPSLMRQYMNHGLTILMYMQRSGLFMVLFRCWWKPTVQGV